MPGVQGAPNVRRRAVQPRHRCKVCPVYQQCPSMPKGEADTIRRCLERERLCETSSPSLVWGLSRDMGVDTQSSAQRRASL